MTINAAATVNDPITNERKGEIFAAIERTERGWFELVWRSHKTYKIVGQVVVEQFRSERAALNYIIANDLNPKCSA